MFFSQFAVNSKQGMRMESTIVIVTVAAFRLGMLIDYSVVKETKTEGQKIVLIFFFYVEMLRYGKNVKVNFCKIQ